MSADNTSRTARPSTFEYLSNEEAAATLAFQTANPALGLLLLSLWSDSAWVMEGLAGNERLSPGARECAAERLEILTAGGAQ